MNTSRESVISDCLGHSQTLFGGSEQLLESWMFAKLVEVRVRFEMPYVLSGSHALEERLERIDRVVIGASGQREGAGQIVAHDEIFGVEEQSAPAPVAAALNVAEHDERVRTCRESLTVRRFLGDCTLRPLQDHFGGLAQF